MVPDNSDVLTNIEKMLKRLLAERQPREKAKCFNCGKSGHYQRNCRAPRKGTRPASPPRNMKKAYGQQSNQECPTFSLSVMQQGKNNLTACGYINGNKRTFTIDTGATRSVIRPDVIKEYEPLDNVRLRTATGELATVYGKMEAEVTIANISVKHLFIVADIVDEVILGIDFMVTHGISINMGQQKMSWRNVNIPLHMGYENQVRRKLKCKHCVNGKTKEAIVDVRLTRVEENDVWSIEQRNDPILSKIIKAMKNGTRPTRKEIAAEETQSKAYWAQWNSLRLLNGRLYRTWESEDGKTGRKLIVVPSSKMNEVLKQYHNGPRGGHFGVKKTLEKLKQRFYWVGCKQAVAEWVANCSRCMTTKRSPVQEFIGKSKRANEKGVRCDEGQENLNDLQELMRIRPKLERDGMKTSCNQTAHDDGYCEGQLVLLYNSKRKKELSPKLRTNWDGPYRIIKRINDVAYRIQKHKSPRSKMKVVHLERMALYGSDA